MLFDIKLPVIHQSITTGETIIFSDPMYNHGNAYRTDLGIFEPPVNGIYSLTATICVFPASFIVFGIMKNDTVLDQIVSGQTQWHECNTITTNAYLTVMDIVFVKALAVSGEYGILDSDFGVPSFKGILLSTLKP